MCVRLSLSLPGTTEPASEGENADSGFHIGEALQQNRCRNHSTSTQGCVTQGIIINGCIRDSDDISRMPLGVKALNTYPLKSSKRDPGLRNVPVAFGGVIFRPGDWIYADKDGIIVSPEELKLS